MSQKINPPHPTKKKDGTGLKVSCLKYKNNMKRKQNSHLYRLTCLEVAAVAGVTSYLQHTTSHTNLINHPSNQLPHFPISNNFYKFFAVFGQFVSFADFHFYISIFQIFICRKISPPRNIPTFLKRKNAEFSSDMRQQNRESQVAFTYVLYALCMQCRLC